MRARSRARRRRRWRPVALLVAVATAAALGWWINAGGMRALDGWWAGHGGEHVGGHGDVTDEERRQLRELLESIDREQDSR